MFLYTHPKIAPNTAPRPPRRPDNDFSDMPPAIQAILNPTRFRGE